MTRWSASPRLGMAVLGRYPGRGLARHTNGISGPRLSLAAFALEVGMDRPGGLSAIGNTPVTRLARLAGDGDAEVWVKMEAANPTGSYKGRMARAPIEAAEATRGAG